MVDTENCELNICKSWHAHLAQKYDALNPASFAVVDNIIVHTHERRPWHVSLIVCHEDMDVNAILAGHCGAPERPVSDWKQHGLIEPQSFADALHMHSVAWVPKQVPRKLFLCYSVDNYELLLVARVCHHGQNMTLVLRATNTKDGTIPYYVDVLCRSTSTIVGRELTLDGDARFQNPPDTRFVLSSWGDWDLDVLVQPFRDQDFTPRQCVPWQPGTFVLPWRDGEPVGVIDASGSVKCCTLVGALKVAAVTISYLGRELQDTKADAALLCRWFPERLQRVFVLEKDGNCVRLLCQGRAMQAMVVWMSS
jgi:hypothetical protein